MGGAGGAVSAGTAGTAAAAARSGDTAAEHAVSGHTEPDHDRVTRWEYAAWAPLIALTLLIGLWPKTLLDLTDAPVRALLGGG